MDQSKGPGERDGVITGGQCVDYVRGCRGCRMSTCQGRNKWFLRKGRVEGDGYQYDRGGTEKRIRTHHEMR